jgi:hypothetical protein
MIFQKCSQNKKKRKKKTKSSSRQLQIGKHTVKRVERDGLPSYEVQKRKLDFCKSYGLKSELFWPCLVPKNFRFRVL